MTIGTTTRGYINSKRDILPAGWAVRIFRKIRATVHDFPDPVVPSTAKCFANKSSTSWR